MDDIGKAFIMGVEILLFILALTIAVFSYYNLMNHIDGVMLSSDYSNRGDSIVSNNDLELKRKVNRAEIIIAILNLTKNKNSIIEVRNGGTHTFSYHYDNTTGSDEIHYSGPGGNIDYDPNDIGFRSHLLSNVVGASTNTFSLTVYKTGTNARLVYTIN